MAAERPPRIRVLRIIARMNVGGPAYHVSLLSGRLDPARYESLLVSGRMGPGEESFDALASRYGARHELVQDLGPELRPLADVKTTWHLARLVRRFRPDIVHTHTAKAGMVGRIAARIAAGRRPLVIHTFHGHVLTGYFGPLLSGFYRLLERLLALMSTRLVAVSQAVADDLVRLGVAPAEKFRVVPLGLDLDAFLGCVPADGTGFRAELGIEDDATLLVFVGRLVPIKRVDVLLEAVSMAITDGARVRLAIVGDGPERAALESLAAAGAEAEQVHFLGFRSDLAEIYAAADIAVLTSDNEGTPVALIEAAAAATPAIATDVGGVCDVVSRASGRLVPAGDAPAFARAIAELDADSQLRSEMGDAARQHVRERYASDRLLADIDELYTTELDRRRRA